jgi:hypothetical protein
VPRTRFVAVSMSVTAFDVTLMAASIVPSGEKPRPCTSISFL